MPTAVYYNISCGAGSRGLSLSFNHNKEQRRCRPLYTRMPAVQPTLTPDEPQTLALYEMKKS
jgi:hypothetical protein